MVKESSTDNGNARWENAFIAYFHYPWLSSARLLSPNNSASSYCNGALILKRRLEYIREGQTVRVIWPASTEIEDAFLRVYLYAQNEPKALRVR